MILRFFRRLREFAGFVGRVIDADETGVYRMDPVTAWQLACVRYPSPAGAARHRRETQEAIEWAVAMRARINDDTSR